MRGPERIRASATGPRPHGPRRLRVGEAGGAATLAVAAAEALPLAIGACLRETIDHVLPAGPVALEIPMTVRMRF